MNSNIRTLIILWCIIIFLGFSKNLYSQTSNALFKVVPNVETALSASELNSYADLDTDKVREKTLIEITGLEQVLQNPVISVPLKGANHILRHESFSLTKAETFTFKGSFTEALGEVYLYQTNGYLYGNIHIDSLSYQIEPVNTRYAVLLRRDYSEDICPLGEDHGEKEDSSENQENGYKKSKNGLMTNPVVDVMVIFSNQAAAATSNMEALALGSILSRILLFPIAMQE